MKLKKLKKLNKRVNKIINSEISWEAKYDLIFSKKISTKIFESTSFDYCDPDTTYEEDVLAFTNAFNNYCNYD